MAQQPDPGVAKQGRIIDPNYGILSRLKGQTLTINPTVQASLCDAGEVVDLAVASAR